MKKKNLLLRRRLVLPIYQQEVILYVSVSLTKTYKRIAHRYGLTPEVDGYPGAYMLSGKGRFALVFEEDCVDEASIAHEVDHLATELLSYVGYAGKGEPRTYLVGYLSQWVKKQLKKSGIYS